MMKAFLLILLAVALIGVVYVRSSERETEREATSLPISLSDMHIEVADTDAARVQGLSGRAELPDKYGMLFVFEESGNYGIWMKDMLIPIDIVWIKDNGEILGVEKEVSPRTFPNVFYPPAPVRYVLEIAAGAAEEYGFSTGTVLDIESIY